MDDKDKKNISILDKLPFLKKMKEVKHIGLIVTVIFVLILLFILFGNFDLSFLKSNNNVRASSSLNETTTYQTSTEYVEHLEKKLTSLLSSVKGAGNVEVMISIKNGTGINLAQNTETKTTSSDGGDITTVSTSPILIENNGNQTPIIISEILPEINGVVVVSSGAYDVNVKMYLISAVQTLLDITQDKIQILIGK